MLVSSAMKSAAILVRFKIRSTSFSIVALAFKAPRHRIIHLLTDEEDIDEDVNHLADSHITQLKRQEMGSPPVKSAIRLSCWVYALQEYARMYYKQTASHGASHTPVIASHPHATRCRKLRDPCTPIRRPAVSSEHPAELLRLKQAGVSIDSFYKDLAA